MSVNVFVRLDERPLVTFRDGPTGRRAGLIGGPDVWEIAMWIDAVKLLLDRGLLGSAADPWL